MKPASLCVLIPITAENEVTQMTNKSIWNYFLIVTDDKNEFSVILHHEWYNLGNEKPTQILRKFIAIRGNGRNADFANIKLRRFQLTEVISK